MTQVRFAVVLVATLAGLLGIVRLGNAPPAPPMTVEDAENPELWRQVRALGEGPMEWQTAAAFAAYEEEGEDDERGSSPD